jgi:ribosomal protein S18 acetylase RimI-like enzyme
VLAEMQRCDLPTGRTEHVAIRDATVADADSIARLVSELGYPTSASQMRCRLEAIVRDADYATLVACDEGEVVGFVGTRIGPLYEDDEQYGQIMALVVAAEHRRRGVGRVLMQAAESKLVERGARVAVVLSGHHRPDAHTFYESRGYAFTGRRYKKPLSLSE